MRHHHPEILFDGLHAQRAVAPHAGKNNPDGFFLLVGRQVPEEEVDGHPLSPGHDRFQQLQFAVQDREVRIGRNHIDAILADLHPIFHLGHRHLGVPGQEFGHHALVRWLKMRHQHERQPGIRGQVREELLEGLQAARGGTHADDVRDGLFGTARSRSFRHEVGRIFVRFPGLRHKQSPKEARWPSPARRRPDPPRSSKAFIVYAMYPKGAIITPA